jgi:hypothetical protein
MEYEMEHKMKNNNVSLFSKILSMAALLILLGLMEGCAGASHPPPERIVLTEEQKKILIINNDPLTNRRLRKECQVIAVESVTHPIALRIVACQKGGNVVEVMHTGSGRSTGTYNNYYGAYSYSSTTHSYDETYSAAVIYKCPNGFSLQ